MGESNLTEKIDRIADNIAESYSVAEELGATMPDNQNSNNLPGTLRSLPPANTYLPKAGGTMTGVLKAQNNSQYLVAQVRNVVFVPDGDDPPATNDGDFILFYQEPET